MYSIEFVCIAFKSVKGEVVPLHAMKVYVGRGVILPVILDVGTTYR
jgi:hypothetical protein